jgi:hypothetical protein
VHHSTLAEDIAGGNPPRSPKKTSQNNGPKNVSGGNPPPSLSGEAAAKLVQRQEKKIESHQTAEQRRQESRTAPDRIDGAVP